MAITTRGGITYVYVSQLSDLSDIVLTNPTNGQVLTYQNGVWINSTVGGGGGSTIGAAVSGGTPNSILYIDPSGNLGQTNPGFTYNAATNAFISGVGVTNATTRSLNTFGGTYTGASVNQTGITIANTINQTGTSSFVDLLINRTNTAAPGSQKLTDMFVNGGSVFSILTNGNVFSTGTISAANLTATSTVSTAFLGVTNAGANVFIPSVNSAVSSVTAQNQFAGSSNNFLRVAVSSTNATALPASVNYSQFIVGTNPISFVSGALTSGFVANAVVGSLGAITANGNTITNSASLYVGPSTTGATNSYTAYFDTGAVLMNGIVNVTASLAVGTSVVLGNQLGVTGGFASSAAPAAVGGIGALQVYAQTYTSSAATNSVTNVGINSIGIPTLVTTNPWTITNLSTVYIDGAAQAGSGVTATHLYALNINSGNTRLGADLLVLNNTTLAGANNVVGSSTLLGSVLGISSDVTTGGTSSASGRIFSVANGTINRTADTGTYAQSAASSFGSQVLVAGSASTYTNASTVYIDGPPVASTNVTITNANSLFIRTGNVFMGGKISNYNNVATAGQGVPSIYASGRSTAQAAAVASVATYTVGAADGSFLVSANANITTFVAGTFNVTVTYTDETNTSRTLSLNFSSITGTLGIAIAAAGPFEGLPVHIRCKASTSITIATSGTFTSLTYNVEGVIQQLS